MSDLSQKRAPFIVTPWDETNVSKCACCGNITKTIWGDVGDSERALAVYYVGWTVGTDKHHASVDLILGDWGEESKPDGRVLVSLVFRPGKDGGFIVVDSAGRPADDRQLCGTALKRADVVGTPLAARVFELVDAIWLQDRRIREVNQLKRLPYSKN